MGERNGMRNGIDRNELELDVIEGDESFGDGRAKR